MGFPTVPRLGRRRRIARCNIPGCFAIVVAVFIVFPPVPRPRPDTSTALRITSRGGEFFLAGFPTPPGLGRRRRIARCAVPGCFTVVTAVLIIFLPVPRPRPVAASAAALRRPRFAWLYTELTVFPVPVGHLQAVSASKTEKTKLLIL